MITMVMMHLLRVVEQEVEIHLQEADLEDKMVHLHTHGQILVAKILLEMQILEIHLISSRVFLEAEETRLVVKGQGKYQDIQSDSRLWKLLKV